MAAKLKNNVHDMKIKDMPPMNPEYFLQLADAYSYLLSQDGLEDLTTAPVFGSVANETATKSFHKPEALRRLLQTEGEAETAFNGFALNPFWTPVTNVPYNKGNVARLVQTYQKDKQILNTAKFYCLCSDKNADPHAALGDIKVISPLEPLHAAVLAFHIAHKEGISDIEFRAWLKLIRSVTCVFKVITSKKDRLCHTRV